MKTIREITSIAVDRPEKGSITIVAKYGSEHFGQPSRRITVGEYTPNPKWSRAHQLTDEAYLILRNGAKSVAWMVEVLSEIACALEPSLSWSPIIVTQPQSKSCKVEETTSVSVEVGVSESPLNYRWQRFCDSQWFEIATNEPTYSGQETATLLCKPSVSGQIKLRCAVTNLSGATNSDEVILTIT
jgi:hypothetical protein